MLTRPSRTAGDRDEGFTLVELLVVMIIIGILSAIAVPVFLSQRQKAQDTATKSDVSNLGQQISTYYVDNTKQLGAGSITVPSGGGAGALSIDESGTGGATGVIKMNVSENVIAPTGGIVSYNGPSGCTNYAVTWVVHLTNNSGSKKDWYYSAQSGLSSTAPAALTACP